MIKIKNLEKWYHIFSREELSALMIFYEAGYDVIQRTDIKHIAVSKLTEVRQVDMVSRREGYLIPDDWFQGIEEYTEYFFKDIFQEVEDEIK